MQPIESDPERLATFREYVASGRARSAVSLLDDGWTVNESTIAGVCDANTKEEMRFFVSSRESQLGRVYVIDDAPSTFPHVATSARASYQLRHFDMMEEYPRALQALTAYKVHAARSDVSPEFVQWLEERRSNSGFAERVGRHFRWTPEATS
jgi:hypothetical protein